MRNCESAGEVRPYPVRTAATHRPDGAMTGDAPTNGPSSRTFRSSWAGSRCVREGRRGRRGRRRGGDRGDRRGRQVLGEQAGGSCGGGRRRDTPVGTTGIPAPGRTV